MGKPRNWEWCRDSRRTAITVYAAGVARPHCGNTGAWLVVLEPEVLAEVNLANVLIINDLPGRPRCEHAALVDDVRAVADAERLPHVVIGDQHADAALLEEADDLLDVEHGDGVDTRERLVEQDEARP